MAIDWNSLWEKVKQTTKAKGISSLHDLDVNEISLVSDPANLLSKVVIYKKHDPEGEGVDIQNQPVVPEKEEVLPAMDEHGGASEEVEMLKGIIEQQEEVIDTLVKAVEEVVGPEELDKMALEDEDTGEMPPDPGPSEEYEDDEEDMDKMEVGHDPENAMHEFPPDEIYGEDLQKAFSTLDPLVAGVIADLGAQVEAQREDIIKSNALLMEREGQIRAAELHDAASRMAGLPMTQDDTVQFLSVLDQSLPPDQYDMIEAKLEQMSDVMMTQPITKEYGTSMPAYNHPTDDVIAYATQVAGEVVQKSGGEATPEQARAAVWKANPELYNEYVMQQRIQGR